MSTDTHTATEGGVEAAALLLLEILMERSKTDPSSKITHLPMGATARHPEGYATTVEYLAWQRRSTPMRTHGSERQSHRRWMPPTTTVTAILEGNGRRFGNAEAKRQRARADAARFWYGVPRIILG